jgi:hypothetical protein
MYFKQLIAKYVIGNLPPNEIPEFAYTAMKDGYDSPSLHILAGLEGNNLNPYEVNKYLKLAINELGLTMPDLRQAALEYAATLAEQIIYNRTDVYSGVGEIIHTAIGKYNFNNENKDHVLDSIFFDDVYSIYYTYEDVLHGDLSCYNPDWIKGKSNEELIVECEKRLFEALKVWNDKIKSLIV